MRTQWRQSFLLGWPTLEFWGRMSNPLRCLDVRCMCCLIQTVEQRMSHSQQRYSCMSSSMRLLVSHDPLCSHSYLHYFRGHRIPDILEQVFKLSVILPRSCLDLVFQIESCELKQQERKNSPQHSLDARCKGFGGGRKWHLWWRCYYKLCPKLWSHCGDQGSNRNHLRQFLLPLGEIRKSQQGQLQVLGQKLELMLQGLEWQRLERQQPELLRLQQLVLDQPSLKQVFLLRFHQLLFRSLERLAQV